jgi:NAD(P)H-dependent FMN reductase
MTGTISAVADLAIDAASSAIPGWGNVVVGVTSDVSGFGESVGETLGPVVQFFKDFQFPGSLFTAGQTSLIKEANTKSAKPGKCNK